MLKRILQGIILMIAFHTIAGAIEEEEIKSGVPKKIPALEKTADPSKEDKEVEVLSVKFQQAVQVSQPLTLTLTRFSDRVLARYPQQLNVKGNKHDLYGEKKHDFVQHLFNFSNGDSYSTHLLAKGIYMSGNSVWSESFTTALDIPDPSKTPDKVIDWVSYKSGKSISEDYYRRRPSHDRSGGHAEPQFIADIEEAFRKNHNAVVALFSPSEEDKNPIHMCGIELFGPYDMCDDCLNQLHLFKERQRDGAATISRAIRDKLKDNFKGDEGDAFVLIYHSKHAYKEVKTYSAEKDEKNRHALTYSGVFGNGNHRFISGTPIDDGSELFQPISVLTMPSMIYGYIHHLSNRRARYVSQYFSFP